MLYCTAIQQCRQFGYRGGCPVAESVADRLITLPNHAALTGQDIDSVAQAFLSSLRAYRNRQVRSRLHLGFSADAEQRGKIA
jgi:hypothetical protein